MRTFSLAASLCLPGCFQPQPDCESSEVDFDYNDGTPTLSWSDLAGPDTRPHVTVRFDRPEATSVADACDSGALGLWEVSGEFDTITYGRLPAHGRVDFHAAEDGQVRSMRLQEGTIYLAQVGITDGLIWEKGSYACVDGWAYAWRHGEPDSVVQCRGSFDTGTAP